MKKKGVLDRFPMHLFTGGDARGPVLIVDSANLGRLDMESTAEKDETILVVSQDRTRLEHTREAMDGARTERVGLIQLIQADPERLPLRDQSVQAVVMHPDKKPRAGRITASDAFADRYQECDRVLRSDGRLVVLQRTSSSEPVPGRSEPGASAESHTYYVRPAVGSSYFITQEWLPFSHSLRSFERGRLKSIRIYADLVISRMGVRRLYNSVNLRVHHKNGAQGVIHRYSQTTDSYGGSKNGAETPQGGFSALARTGWKTLVLRDESSREVMQIPLCAIISERMEKELESINAINAYGNPLLSAVLPKVLDRGAIDGQPYWIETRLEGISAATFSWKPGWNRTTTESAVSFITNLHQAHCQRAQIHRKLFDELLGPQVANLTEETRKVYEGFDLGPLVRSLWDLFGGRQVPLVRTHGDFWPGNFLVSAEGKLTGVIDWDLSSEQGWPLLDVLHLVVFQRKWWAVRGFGSIVTGKLMDRRIAGRLSDLITKYCYEMEIDDDLWAGFVALYWLGYTSHFVSAGWDKARVRKNVIEPLPLLVQAVSTRGYYSTAGELDNSIGNRVAR